MRKIQKICLSFSKWEYFCQNLRIIRQFWQKYSHWENSGKCAVSFSKLSNNFCQFRMSSRNSIEWQANKYFSRHVLLYLKKWLGKKWKKMSKIRNFPLKMIIFILKSANYSPILEKNAHFEKKNPNFVEKDRFFHTIFPGVHVSC